jgi:integrase
MAAKMERTKTPGIFKRGSRYVFSYRVNGRQRWESFRTLDEARRAKSARATDIERGEFVERSRVTLHVYAAEWIDRYQGRGRRGFRENTRDEYRELLTRCALKRFPESLPLTQITPSHVAGFVSWLCDPVAQGASLSDSSVRNALTPLRACLATAVREGLIRSNPARDVDLPHRPTAEDSEAEEIRAMSREELATLLALIPGDWQTFFRFLAATGLRVSEAIALQWHHLELDGGAAHVKVRRAIVRGRVGPPKSRHGRREVPLDHSQVVALRERRIASERPGDDDLVFPASNGAVMSPNNLRRRVLKPAAEEACVSWVGFHAFRHTAASMLFADGRNAVQVQRWLGHHSAAFTLATYVHLLDGDIGAPLTLPERANGVQTWSTPLDATPVAEQAAKMAA